MEIEQAAHTGPGRPRKPVDKDLIYKLAAIHCSNPEISSIVGISVDTLQRKYNDIIHAGKDSGKQKLRRKMWESAMNGNVTMMIWLSKNILGYTDSVLVSEEKKPLPWSDEDTTTVEPITAPDAEEGEDITGVVREDLDQLKEDLSRVV